MENHTQFKDTPAEFTMIAIQGGTFDMGSDDKEADNDEKPVHNIILSDYWLGEYPVTQAVWAYVMQDTDMPDPAHFKGANRPVEQVSWDDIVEQFLPKLNAITEGVRPEGTKYYLPTEAQWEYAAIGGKYWNIYPFKYSGSDKLNEVGWYAENSYGETKPVGLKTPNLLGLYDMIGNIWEWCEDKREGYKENYEAVISQYIKNAFMGAIFNPTGVKEGYYRVPRGGCSFDDAQYCRPTSRDNNTPSYRYYGIGFRLALFSPSV